MIKTEENTFVLTADEMTMCAYALRMLIQQNLQGLINHPDKDTRKYALSTMDYCNNMLNQIEPKDYD